MQVTRTAALVFGVALAFSLDVGAQAPGRGAAAQRGNRQAPTAARGTQAGPAGAAATAEGMPAAEASPVESHQKLTVRGQTLAYTAHAGLLAVRNAAGAAEAHIFYTYYAKDGAGDAGSRPLMFVLGGAPGVAAAWQDLGGLGPKRLKLMADGTAGLPPYQWTDNPDSALDMADLVFVNPVGTAYSRADAASRASEFATTSRDSEVAGEFIRGFLQTYRRWNSPRVLLGEDFGTGRTAAVALYLTEHHIPVNGVALLSMAPHAEATAGDEEYMTLLPSETLAAWAHRKLPADLQAMTLDQVAERARQFASREYLHALYKGDRMTADERTRATADLSHLTGLSPAFVANSDLRVSWDRFSTSLLGADRRLSATDDRLASYEAPSPFGRRGGRGRRGAPPPPPLDAAQQGMGSGLLTAYQAYLAHDLGFEGKGVFELVNGRPDAFTVTATDDTSLADLFARNPHARLFVAVNYFDAGDPFYASEFTLAHLSVSPDVRAHNVTVDHFASGRSVYADAHGAAKLHADLARFVASITAPSGE